MNAVNEKLLNLSRMTAKIIPMQELLSFVEYTQRAGTREKAGVLLVGQPHQGLFEIAQAMLNPFKSHAARITRDYRILLKYGESMTYSIDLGEGLLPVEEGKFYAALAEYSNATLPLLCGEIQLPIEALKNIDLTLLASANDFENIDWDVEMTSTDYCYFTLTAIAMLTMAERSVLEQHLMKYMTNSLGVIISRSDLVTPQDMPEIMELAQSIFTEGKYPLYYLPDKDESLLNYDFNSLGLRKDSLFKESENRIATICREKVVKEILDYMAYLKTDGEKISQAAAYIDERRERLTVRSSSAMHYIQINYLNLFQAEIIRGLFDFNEALKRRLEGDIQNITALDRLQADTPDYIRARWEEELKKVSSRIDLQLKEITESADGYILKDINKLVAEDAREDLSELIVNTSKYAAGTISTYPDTFGYTAPRNWKRYAANGVQALGVILLFSNFITGTAAILGAHCYKRVSEKKFIAENQNAIIEEAGKFSNEIYAEVKKNIENNFAELEGEFSVAVRNCYQANIERLAEALAEKQAEEAGNEERLGELAGILSSVKELDF